MSSRRPALVTCITIDASCSASLYLTADEVALATAGRFVQRSVRHRSSSLLPLAESINAMPLLRLLPLQPSQVSRPAHSFASHLRWPLPFSVLLLVDAVILDALSDNNNDIDVIIAIIIRDAIAE